MSARSPKCRGAVAVEVQELLHGGCNSPEVVGRNSGGDDQHPLVKFVPVKELAGEDQVIVAVPGDKATLFRIKSSTPRPAARRT